MAKSSAKYIAKSSFDDLLRATTVYNFNHKWGKIAYVLSYFVFNVLTQLKFEVKYKTDDGTLKYSYSLSELTPELSWELILRGMSLYSKRETIILTKNIKKGIKYFLKVPTYEDTETCIRIAKYISSCASKLAKECGLPKYKKKNKDKSVTAFDHKFDIVMKFIYENFPLCSKALICALAPGFVLTPKTKPVTESELRMISREVHPDKMTSPSIPEKVRKVAEISIVLLNALREDNLSEMPYSFEDMYDIINT
jgi:hypothetical protein